MGNSVLDELSEGEVGVYTEADGREIAMLVPTPDRHREMTDLQISLVSCAMRLQTDPEFVEEMVEWLETRKQ